MRLFIEPRKYDDESAIRSAELILSKINKGDGKIHQVAENCSVKIAETVDMMQEYDEIVFPRYAVPMKGYHPWCLNGANVLFIGRLFHVMSEKKITGKRIIFLISEQSMMWSSFTGAIFDKVFGKNNNSLQLMDIGNMRWQDIDIDKVLEFEMDYTRPEPVEEEPPPTPKKKPASKSSKIKSKK